MNKKIEIKNEHFFKNKWQMVIYLILFAILFWLFIYLGNLDYNQNIPDNVRFATEFNKVSEDNVFTYVNSQDTYLLFNKEKAIILFGFKNDWVNYYAKIVNEVAVSEGIDKIYYYNFLEDRNLSNGTYESIVNYLDEYVPTIDTGHKDIYAPTLVIINNKRIDFYDDETAIMSRNITPEEYWNEYHVATKKSELEVAFKNYLGS